MLGHRERMEENGIAPLTWEGKRSAAAAPDAEVVDRPLRAGGSVRRTSCGSSQKRTGARSRER